MIEITPKRVTFAGQKTQQLNLLNKSAHPLLFKVKTNKIQSIDARPSFSRIGFNQSVKITVKKGNQFADNTKIKISYVECDDTVTDTNLKQAWNRFGKQPQYLIIDVCQEQNGENNNGASGESRSAIQPSLFESTFSMKEQKKVDESKKQEFESQIKVEQSKQDNLKTQIQSLETKIMKTQEKIKIQHPHKNQTNFMQVFSKPYIIFPLILVVFALGYLSGNTYAASAPL